MLIIGGAVGLIMATYLAHQYPGSVTSVKLFGTPRVGNDKWADYVESTVSHMVFDTRKASLRRLMISWETRSAS